MDFYFCGKYINTDYDDKYVERAMFGVVPLFRGFDGRYGFLLIPTPGGQKERKRKKKTTFIKNTNSIVNKREKLLKPIKSHHHKLKNYLKKACLRA